MTYREKLELYSQGKLDEKERIEIEKELEKQEALADYLFEHQAPPGMDDFFGETSPFDVSGEDAEIPELNDDTETIAKQINSSIRKAFIKTGVIAAIAAIVLTLFVVFAMPHIVDSFYYDPSKNAGLDENGVEVEQFERDMSVYAEMVMPGLGPQIRAGSNSYGYGNYDFYIDSRYQVGDNNQPVKKVFSGHIKRNSVVCYNYEELLEYEGSDNYNSDLDDEKKASLSQMNDSDLYYAYVTFDQLMPYEKFFANYVENDAYGTNVSWVWCGVKVHPDENANAHGGYGFYAKTNGSETEYEYNNETYPMLAWENGSKSLDTEKKAYTHFNSMIRYLADNEKFAELDNNLNVNDSLYIIDDIENYVSQNGIQLYGFAYVGDKEHIEAIANADGVQQVVVRKVNSNTGM